MRDDDCRTAVVSIAMTVRVMVIPMVIVAVPRLVGVVVTARGHETDEHEGQHC